MKIPFSVSLLIGFIILVFICVLQRQDEIASSGNPRYGYMAFNGADTSKATGIMAYWKKTENPERSAAVKKIIFIDYAFMFIYCLYLFLSLLYYYRKEGRIFVKILLGLAIVALLAGTALDAWQDWKIYKFITIATVVEDMRSYTQIKWITLVTAVAVFILMLLPRDFISITFVKRALRFLSQLLKSLWLFFPGILFLVIPVFCFWIMGQGKDIIAAFINTKAGPVKAFNYTRIIFFIAIAFWAYVSWYSARIISYIKKTRQQTDMESVNHLSRSETEIAYDAHDRFFDIGKDFLDEFPRLIGNGCFLVLELAVFQSSLLASPIGGLAAWMFFLLGLIALRYINKWIVDTQAGRQVFRKAFWYLVVGFLALIAVISFIGMTIWVLFLLVLLLHIIFIYYINLRRVMMENDAAAKKMLRSGADRTLLEKMMDYLCVPRKESGYFRWFLILGVNGIVLYIMGIFWLAFSRWLGPFPFIILAFAVLLAFGNVVAAFSVKFKVNFHFLLLVLAFVFGLKETHNVRTYELKNVYNGYEKKPDLKTYLNAWLNERLDSSQSRYDMYFIMANGGASRSGYWTAAVLGRIEDASLNDSLPGRFSDHLFCLSGTSGGGVGVATFFSLLRNKQEHTKQYYQASAQEFLNQDYFTYTFARMLGPDFFNYIFHLPLVDDRAGALESSFEKSAKYRSGDHYQVPFDDDFSNFPALKDKKIFLPVLFVNTTRMQDGNPGVVSNLDLKGDIFNNRIDVVRLIDSNKDISISTASILGARFPYLSPAGRISDSYFVDGGYFDNSGAGVVQEMIRGIINIAKSDPELAKRINRINFKVLHIINSPPMEGFVPANIKPVAPINNDLMSPILTIMGAYNMQTTVNDQRLINYIKDINEDKINMAYYQQISLYLTAKEWKADNIYDHSRMEPAYAMNWFMSDTTVRRINKRLLSNPPVKALTDSVEW